MSAVAGPSPSVKTQGAGSSSFRCEPKRRSGPSGTALCSVLLAGALMLAAEPRLAGAQQPSPAQAQQLLQQNPALADVIRQRLQQSGLTAEQVRARLQASGYPANLLDAYLGSGVAPSAQPAGALELAAIQALGLPPVEQSLLAVDTGLIRMRGAYSPSRVFGVDVFRRTTTQFLPLLSGPVPADYKLGPGDVLVLILTGDVELAYTEQADMREVAVRRGGKPIATLDLYDYVLRGDTHSDIRLETGDVVFVPVHGIRAEVTGAVVRPAIYELKPTETLADLVRTAGGI